MIGFVFNFLSPFIQCIHVCSCIQQLRKRLFLPSIQLLVQSPIRLPVQSHKLQRNQIYPTDQLTPPPLFSPSFPFAAPCFVEEVDGIYEDGEIFEVDDCTTCACNDGEVLCQTEQCKQPNCLNPITKAGECCPACPDEVSTKHQTLF